MRVIDAKTKTMLLKALERGEFTTSDIDRLKAFLGCSDFFHEVNVETPEVPIEEYNLPLEEIDVQVENYP